MRSEEVTLELEAGRFCRPTTPISLYLCVWYTVRIAHSYVGGFLSFRSRMIIMSHQPISILGGRETSSVSLHSLPCKVECEVEGSVSKEATSERGRRTAQVDSYFEPVIRDGSGTTFLGNQSSQILTATFRGRQLKGVEVTVPEGYRGVVLREQGTVSHDSQV